MLELWETTHFPNCCNLLQVLALTVPVSDWHPNVWGLEIYNWYLKEPPNLLGKKRLKDFLTNIGIYACQVIYNDGPLARLTFGKLSTQFLCGTAVPLDSRLSQPALYGFVSFRSGNCRGMTWRFRWERSAGTNEF